MKYKHTHTRAVLITLMPCWSIIIDLIDSIQFNCSRVVGYWVRRGNSTDFMFCMCLCRGWEEGMSGSSVSDRQRHLLRAVTAHSDSLPGELSMLCGVIFEWWFPTDWMRLRGEGWVDWRLTDSAIYWGRSKLIAIHCQENYRCLRQL